VFLLFASCLVTQSQWEQKYGPLSPDPKQDSGWGHPWAELHWSTAQLQVEVHNREEGAEYHYGLAETHPMCGTDAGIMEGSCWTGEDCHRGFHSEESSYAYCHPVDEGTSLAFIEDPVGLAEGAETLFSQNYVFLVTHILMASTGECWVWGLEPDHYQELDCLNIDP
jgi:hypothetical protein